MPAPFTNRATAGEELADEIKRLGLADPVVLALPRGGVPVAVPVARRLGAPLDLVLVRKIGVPGHEELAAGAVVDGSAHEAVWNTGVLRQISWNEPDREAVVARLLKEIEARRDK